jgi:hypothetical protein
MLSNESDVIEGGVGVHELRERGREGRGETEREGWGETEREVCERETEGRER